MVVLGVGLLAGCYDGPDDMESPKGSPGGLCYDNNTCDLTYTCDAVGEFCYDPVEPCRGVFCNEHGTCQIDGDNRPTCLCESGYLNFRYTLYCEAL